MGSLIRRNLKHKTILAICCVLTSMFYVSCDNEEIFYQFHEIKDAEWAQKDTLIFDIDSTSFELNVPYNLTIEVTNNETYPYRNIWFFVQDNINNDSVFSKIEKEYQLADEFGKWNGVGFGTLYQISLNFDRNIIFKERRNYRIMLEHGMRDQSLKGIEKVGICIAKRK